jgi:hypothetical protein
MGRSRALFDIAALDERLAAVELADFERCRSSALRFEFRIWTNAITAGREPGKKASGFPASWPGRGGHEVSVPITASGAVGR